MSTELYTGPAASAMNGTDLSWIVGLAVTVPLYYLLAVRQRARRPAAVRSPPGTDDGAQLLVTRAATAG